MRKEVSIKYSQVNDDISLLRHSITKFQQLLPSSQSLLKSKNNQSHQGKSVKFKETPSLNSISISNDDNNVDQDFVIPTIPTIPEDEFQSLPKYIIGRITRQKINQQISILNEMIINKYTLLTTNNTNLPISSSSNKEMIKQWKRELLESPDLENAIFLSDYDIKENKQLPTSSLRSMLSLLKSFSRIREVRSPPSLAANNDGGIGGTKWVVLL